MLVNDFTSDWSSYLLDKIVSWVGICRFVVIL